MLTPFRGLTPSPERPDALDDVEAGARRLRDEAGRYQAETVIEQAVQGGGWVWSDAPSMYRYVIEAGGRRVVGLVGEAALADLIPHEGTISADPGKPRPALEVRPLLLLTEEALPEVDDIGPIAAFEFPDGAAHSVTPVDCAGVGGAPFVIADGHHRHRSALRAGDDPRILSMLVGESGAGLEGGAFHRVFSWAPPLPGEIPGFDVEATEPAPRRDAVVWCSPDGAAALVPRPAAVTHLHPAARSSMPLVARDLLYPRLGLSEADAGYADGATEALEAMGTGAVALMPPADVPAVLRAARAGLLMPPKATRFRPKPARGMVMRVVGPSAGS